MREDREEKLEKNTTYSVLACYFASMCAHVRASDISRKKEQNFAGFSGANSRKNRPISRDFRGKKVKIRGTIGRFRAIFEGEKSKFEKNRPISRDFSGKKSIFEGFSGANS